METTTTPVNGVVDQLLRIVRPFVGAVNVNLGCGRNLLPEFINVDRAPGPRGPVTYRDLWLRQYRVVGDGTQRR